MENKHEYDVQYHIDGAGKRQKIKRTLGISGSPQNRASEVIKHIERRADKINLHVKRRLIDNRRRGIHPFEKRAGEKKTDNRYDHAGNQRYGNGGMYRLLRRFPVAGPISARHKNAGTDGKPDKGIYDQTGKRAGSANRTNRRIGRRRKLSDDDQVRRIVKQLEHIGQHQRNGEANDFSEQRTVCHIDFIIYLFSHISPLDPRKSNISIYEIRSPLIRKFARILFVFSQV